MPSFTDNDLDNRDYWLLQNGAINLYRRKDFFSEDCAALEALDYRLIRLRYTDAQSFQREMSDGLNWEAAFGYSPWNGNLNALNDGFREFPFSNTGKAALCIEDFDKLVKEDEKEAYPTAFNLLDMLADQSRNHLLFGNRLIGLIQTSDPLYDPGKLGGQRVNWNNREWLMKDRDL